MRLKRIELEQIKSSNSLKAIIVRISYLTCMYSMDNSSLISRGMNGKKRSHYVRISIETCYIEATG